MLVETDIVRRARGGRQLLVDDPERLRRVPVVFEASVSRLPDLLPIDPARVYLTGSSFDGVWAWILGLSKPELYVVALSAVSYPEAILDRYRRACRRACRRPRLAPNPLLAPVAVTLPALGSTNP